MNMIYKFVAKYNNNSYEQFYVEQLLVGLINEKNTLMIICSKILYNDCNYLIILFMHMLIG